VLDTVALSLSGSLLAWVLAVRPALTDTHLTGAGVATLIATWVGFVVVLASSTRALLAGRAASAPLGLLGAGVGVFLVSDYFYSAALLHGRAEPTTLMNLALIAFAVLTTAAARVRPAPDHSPTGVGHGEVGPGRLLLIAAALLLGPTVLRAGELWPSHRWRGYRDCLRGRRRRRRGPLVAGGPSQPPPGRV
jgi:hypothetical protein